MVLEGSTLPTPATPQAGGTSSLSLADRCGWIAGTEDKVLADSVRELPRAGIPAPSSLRSIDRSVSRRGFPVCG